MNEVYAIDPDAPKSLNDLRALLERFGPSNGRFIGEYPKDWLNLLEARFNNLSALDRSRFVILLQRHKDLLLHIDAHFFLTKPWIDNAITVNRFHKILVSQPSAKVQSTLEDFLWDQNEAEPSRGDHIPMTVDSYRRACVPLFAISSEIHIVDKYLKLRHDSGDLDRNKIDLLRGLIKEAEVARRCRTFVFHFQLPKGATESFYETSVRSDLENLQAETGLQLMFDVHSNLGHGRYIFSIKGGLQFDHGFMLDRQKRNHVHWLSAAELRPIQKIFGIA